MTAKTTLPNTVQLCLLQQVSLCFIKLMLLMLMVFLVILAVCVGYTLCCGSSQFTAS